MLAAFQFVDRGRTFECSVESPARARPEPWWWFRVSTEQHQRFAPFRADETDTERDVRSRVTAYYDQLLERRAAPPTNYWRRGRQDAQASGTADAAAPVAAEAAVAQ